MRLRVKIISDGTPNGTKIVLQDREDIELSGVTAIQYSINATEESHVVLYMHNVPVEITSDAQVELVSG